MGLGYPQHISCLWVIILATRFMWYQWNGFLTGIFSDGDLFYLGDQFSASCSFSHLQLATDAKVISCSRGSRNLKHLQGCNRWSALQLSLVSCHPTAHDLVTGPMYEIPLNQKSPFWVTGWWCDLPLRPTIWQIWVDVLKPLGEAPALRHTFFWLQAFYGQRSHLKAYPSGWHGLLHHGQ